jgi:hypothetical protein
MRYAVPVFLGATFASATACESPDTVVIVRAGDEQPGDAGSALTAPQTDTVEIPSCPAQPTTHIRMVGNLDYFDIPTGWIGPTAPDSPWSWRQPVTAYASDGTANELLIYFSKAATTTWQYHVFSSSQLNPVELGSGVLHFSQWGALVRREVVRDLRVPQISGQLGPIIEVDVGQPQDEGGDGFSGVTSLDLASDFSSVDVDGNRASIGQSCEEIAQAKRAQHEAAAPGRNQRAPKPATTTVPQASPFQIPEPGTSVADGGVQ